MSRLTDYAISWSAFLRLLSFPDTDSDFSIVIDFDSEQELVFDSLSEALCETYSRLRQHDCDTVQIYFRYYNDELSYEERAHVLLFQFFVFDDSVQIDSYIDLL